MFVYDVCFRYVNNHFETLSSIRKKGELILSRRSAQKSKNELHDMCLLSQFSTLESSKYLTTLWQ